MKAWRLGRRRPGTGQSTGIDSSWRNFLEGAVQRRERLGAQARRHPDTTSVLFERDGRVSTRAGTPAKRTNRKGSQSASY